MKKRLPVFALENIQPLIEQAKTLATPIVDDNYALILIDNDEFDKSDFFFKIRFPDNSNEYVIQVKPISATNNSEQAIGGIKVEKIKDYLQTWLDVLQRYVDVKTIYDNPARYQAQYFYNEFKIVDEDSDSAPFNPSQVFLLDEFIDKFKNTLVKISVNEEDNTEIKEILVDCEELQSELFTASKNKIMTSLSKIWGKTVTKVKKYGKEFIKELYDEFKKEIIGALIKGFLNP